VQRGHRAEAVALPGSDGSTAARDATLESYRAAVVASLERASEPCVLVGHSLGGLSISAAAEARPDLVTALVYLCAVLPHDGFRVDQVEDNGPGYLSMRDFEVDAEGACFTIAPATANRAFYFDCDAADARAAVDRLVPQPIKPIITPVTLTSERWGSVPRYYIETVTDRTIPIAVQRRFAASAPQTRVISMNCGHSPFFSQPQQLADNLCALDGASANPRSRA
jgi:pimeloyl-ACP methyl ester carboxylesterase